MFLYLVLAVGSIIKLHRSFRKWGFLKRGSKFLESKTFQLYTVHNLSQSSFFDSFCVARCEQMTSLYITCKLKRRVKNTYSQEWKSQTEWKTPAFHIHLQKEVIGTSPSKFLISWVYLPINIVQIVYTEAAEINCTITVLLSGQLGNKTTQKQEKVKSWKGGAKTIKAWLTFKCSYLRNS